MDWSNCPDVESNLKIMSGVPVVVGTRVPAESIIDHVADGFSPEEITTEIFPSVPLSRARRIIDFAGLNVPRAA